MAMAANCLIASTACEDRGSALRHPPYLLCETPVLTAASDQYLATILSCKTIGQLREPLRRPSFKPVPGAGLQYHHRLRSLNAEFIQQLIRTLLSLLASAKDADPLNQLEYSQA